MNEFDSKKFEFKKSLGQNFIFDTNLLSAIVSDAEISDSDCVLEIGAGAGTLTEQIALKAKKVLAVETDRRLEQTLREKLYKFSNVEFLFEDFMKVEMSQIEKTLGKNFVVVANLPYYITTPILFRFFEEKVSVKRIVVMVQLEVAKRIVAKENTSEYGILSVQCQHFAKVKITRVVGRKNFKPVPKVDSAIVRLDLKLDNTMKGFSKYVRVCFSMKRKTLVNNLKGQFEKEQIEKAIQEIGYGLNVRAEDVSVSNLETLFFKLSKFNKKVNQNSKIVE